jgi:hypothetical protein
LKDLIYFLSSIITLINFHLIFKVFRGKNDISKRFRYFLIICAVLSIVPLLNAIFVFILLSLVGDEIPEFDKEIKKQKEFKKQPELKSLYALIGIRDIYNNEVSSYNRSQRMYQTLSIRTDNQIENFQNLIILEKKLKTFIDGYTDNEHYKTLLLNNEIMFERILSILKESQKVDNNATIELINMSQESLELFLSQSDELYKKDLEFETEVKETVRNRLITEIKEEIKLQKNQPISAYKFKI